MSVISRHARRITAAAIAAVLLCSLTGCAELGEQAKDTAVLLRDLFMNSISRFPEGNNQAANTPQDTELPPEFTLAPLPTTGLKGVISEDVNIRSGPNEEYDHLGSIRTGTEVQILHQMLLGRSPWGLTDAGWISMNYVVLEDPDKAISLSMEGKTGLLILPEVTVRSGPGWQYPVTETIDGFGQQHLLAQAGTWYRISQGWISQDDIYIEGTQPTRRATITGSEVNVRKGPGTEYSRVGVKYKGDVVTIFQQVSINGKPWGYFGDGWISLNYAKLEKVADSQSQENESNKEQPDLRVGVQDGKILGIWQDVAVSKNQSTLTSLGVWHFNHDGTFLYIGQDTHYHYNSAAGLTSGAADIAEGMELSGFYAYDGSTLVLFCNHAEGATDDVPVPYVRLVQVVMDNGEMTITSGNSTTRLYSGGLDTVAIKLLEQ